MEAMRARLSPAYRGLTTSLRGYAFILARRRLLAHYVMGVARTLLVTAVLAAIAWLSLLLPRWLGLASFSYVLLLRRVAGGMLFVAQLVAPANFRTLFWITLADADEGASKQLESLPVVRGLGATLLSHARQLLGGAVAIAAFGASLPLWLPTAAASVAAFVYATPLVLLALLPLALTVTVVIATGAARKMLAAVSAFSTLAHLAPALLAAACVLAALCGLVPWAALDRLVRAACSWLLCCALAQQSLAPYAALHDARTWAGWARARAWLLAGFGVPSGLAVQYAHPLLALCVLEMTHGAAGILVAAELAAGATCAARESKKE